MPTLKQIICSIELGPGNIKLKEYGSRYGDGHVETFIAVPDTDVPFSIFIKTEGYIAPGLSFFVFMDGEYQCNRNKVGLKLPDAGVQPNEYETEFRLRQKEEKATAGAFVARDWTFAKLKRVDADRAPNLNSQFVNNVGTIEIVAIRCKNGFDGVPLSGSPAAFKQGTNPKYFSSLVSAADPLGTVVGGMDGQFDATCHSINSEESADGSTPKAGAGVKFRPSLGNAWHYTKGESGPESLQIGHACGEVPTLENLKQSPGNEDVFAESDEDRPPTDFEDDETQDEDDDEPFTHHDYDPRTFDRPRGVPLASGLGLMLSDKPYPWDGHHAVEAIENMRQMFKEFPGIDLRIRDEYDIEAEGWAKTNVIDHLLREVRQWEMNDDRIRDVSDIRSRLNGLKMKFDHDVNTVKETRTRNIQTMKRDKANFEAFKKNPWTSDALADIEVMCKIAWHIYGLETQIDWTPMFRKLRSFQQRIFRTKMLQDKPTTLVGKEQMAVLQDHLQDRICALQWFHSRAKRFAGLDIKSLEERMEIVYDREDQIAFELGMDEDEEDRAANNARIVAKKRAKEASPEPIELPSDAVQQPPMESPLGSPSPPPAKQPLQQPSNQSFEKSHVSSLDGGPGQPPQHGFQHGYANYPYPQYNQMMGGYPAYAQHPQQYAAQHPPYPHSDQNAPLHHGGGGMRNAALPQMGAGVVLPDPQMAGNFGPMGGWQAHHMQNQGNLPAGWNGNFQMPGPQGSLQGNPQAGAQPHHNPDIGAAYPEVVNRHLAGPAQDRDRPRAKDWGPIDKEQEKKDNAGWGHGSVHRGHQDHQRFKVQHGEYDPDGDREIHNPRYQRDRQDYGGYNNQAPNNNRKHVETSEELTAQRDVLGGPDNARNSENWGHHDNNYDQGDGQDNAGWHGGDNANDRGNSGWGGYGSQNGHGGDGWAANGDKAWDNYENQNEQGSQGWGTNKDNAWDKKSNSKKSESTNNTHQHWPDDSQSNQGGSKAGSKVNKPQSHRGGGEGWDKSQSNGGGAGPRTWGAQSQHSARSGRMSTGRNGQSEDPKGYIKPYWKDWNKSFDKTACSDGGMKAKHREPRAVYTYPTEPLPKFPADKAKSASHGIQASKGVDYAHLTRRPVYIDSMEAPYAVFSFKYRSKEALEKILKMKIEGVDVKKVKQDVQREKYEGMPKHKLIEELLEKRSAGSVKSGASSASGSKKSKSVQGGGGSKAGDWGGGGSWDAGSRRSNQTQGGQQGRGGGFEQVGEGEIGGGGGGRWGAGSAGGGGVAW